MATLTVLQKRVFMRLQGRYQEHLLGGPRAPGRARQESAIGKSDDRGRKPPRRETGSWRNERYLRPRARFTTRTAVSRCY